MSWQRHQNRSERGSRYLEWLRRVSLHTHSNKEEQFTGEVEKPVFETDTISDVEKLDRL